MAALDRKDYATAQGLFEALGETGAAAALTKGSPPATATPAARTVGPAGPGSRGKAQQRPVTTPPEVIPLRDAAYRQSPPQAKKAKARGLKTLFLRTALVLFAACAAFEMYVSPLNGPVAATKSKVMTGLASTVGLLEQPLEAIARPWRRDKERAEMRDLGAALTQVTIRLDQIEQEHGARLDKLGERIDQESSSRLADTEARLDRLEKKAAVATIPASEFSDVAARLDRLEKKSRSRRRPPPNSPTSRRGSVNWRREPKARPRLSLKAPTAGRGSTGQRREPPSPRIRPSPSRQPSRRSWQKRNPPPRVRQPERPSRGLCSGIIASRTYETA